MNSCTTCDQDIEWDESVGHTPEVCQTCYELADLRLKLEQADTALDRAGISRTDDLDDNHPPMSTAERIDDMAAQWSNSCDLSTDFEKDLEQAEVSLSDRRRLSKYWEDKFKQAEKILAESGWVKK